MTQIYQFIASHASQYPVAIVCRVLGVARSGDYAWRTRSQNPHHRADRRLSVRRGAIFRASRRCYTSPRVHAEVQQQGVRCAQKRVARLMRQAGRTARAARRQLHTTDTRHQLALAENLLKREVTATAPDPEMGRGYHVSADPAGPGVSCGRA